MGRGELLLKWTVCGLKLDFDVGAERPEFLTIAFFFGRNNSVCRGKRFAISFAW